MNIAVLISGSGTTLQNLIDRVEDGSLPVRIVGVLSSKPRVQGLERAKKHGLPTAVVDQDIHDNPRDFSHHVTVALRKWKPELIVMAGFLRRYLPPPEFEHKIINIHPALLPKYGGKGMYGIRVHRAVLRAGETESGCTVHWVDAKYDNGPIIAQTRIPVIPDDTPEYLQDRIQEAERDLYPKVIRDIVEGRTLNSLRQP